MRVRASATSTGPSNTVGSLELECSPAGLCLGFYGVGPYRDGYAPAALTSGTRFVVPWAGVVRATSSPDALYLELDHPGFPHDRLVLSRFVAGPGVPERELVRRRRLLHYAAFGVFVLGALGSMALRPEPLAASLFGPSLLYGAALGLGLVAIGYALDARFFERPANGEEARASFEQDLAVYVPGLLRPGAIPERTKSFELPNLAAWVPRSAAVGGIALAAILLTLLVGGERALDTPERRGNLGPAEVLPTGGAELAHAEREVTEITSPPVTDGLAPNSRERDATEPDLPVPSAPFASSDVATVLGKCVCDRADSSLWKEPIPRLSAILIERRVLPRKTHQKLRIELAVVNNGDTPIAEITVHATFFELDERGRRTHQKERPLYFEGPLAPGRAIKWATEARGTDYELSVPDLGFVSADTGGAAPANAFAELLEANHRPVRLHGARMLAYLGDARGRAGALALKDALRAAEGPYLRRVLEATGEERVCDLRVEPTGSGQRLSACVFNAGSEPGRDLGLSVVSLAGSLDPSQPLANPPEIEAEAKVKIPGELASGTGLKVSVTLPGTFVRGEQHSIEARADSFALLD